MQHTNTHFNLKSCNSGSFFGVFSDSHFRDSSFTVFVLYVTDIIHLIQLAASHMTQWVYCSSLVIMFTPSQRTVLIVRFICDFVDSTIIMRSFVYLFIFNSVTMLCFEEKQLPSKDINLKEDLCLCFLCNDLKYLYIE